MRQSLASRGKDKRNGRKIIQYGTPELDSMMNYDDLSGAAYAAANVIQHLIMANKVAQLTVMAEVDQQGLDIRCVKK